MLEYAVLNRLADGEIIREATLRSTSGASRAVLQDLLRKKWIAREDLSDVRDASRDMCTSQALKTGRGQSSMPTSRRSSITCASRRGSAPPVSALRELAVPRTTLQTLVRRGIVELSEEPASFHMSGLKPRKLEFLFTPAQKSALETIIGGGRPAHSSCPCCCMA